MDLLPDEILCNITRYMGVVTLCRFSCTNWYYYGICVRDCDKYRNFFKKLYKFRFTVILHKGVNLVSLASILPYSHNSYYRKDNGDIMVQLGTGVFNIGVIVPMEGSCSYLVSSSLSNRKSKVMKSYTLALSFLLRHYLINFSFPATILVQFRRIPKKGAIGGLISLYKNVLYRCIINDTIISTDYGKKDNSTLKMFINSYDEIDGKYVMRLGDNNTVVCNSRLEVKQFTMRLYLIQIYGLL